jgi:hypothetical protein
MLLRGQARGLLWRRTDAFGNGAKSKVRNLPGYRVLGFLTSDLALRSDGAGQLSQVLYGGRKVALVEPLDQLGRVPSHAAHPASPRLPGQINLEAWIVVIVERAWPE